jgi:predicted transglutaminase-like cysteine proteinase
VRLVALLLLLTACTPDKELLGSVNTQVNAHPYSKAYDCRMYVRDKYLALLKAGMSAEDMTVVYGLTYGLQPHVILGAEGYFLDNRYPDITKEPRMAVAERIPASDVQWATIK